MYKLFWINFNLLRPCTVTVKINAINTKITVKRKIPTISLTWIILEEKEKVAKETASRLYNYLSNLWAYAVLKDYCEYNYLANINESRSKIFLLKGHILFHSGKFKLSKSYYEKCI